jgi:hypothetical protein
VDSVAPVTPATRNAPDTNRLPKHPIRTMIFPCDPTVRHDAWSRTPPQAQWPARRNERYDHVRPFLSAPRRPHVGYPPQYGPPSRGEVGRGLAVIMIMVVGLLIGTALTVFTVLNPPSAPASSPSPQDSEHSEASVRRDIQPILDTYSSGSYGDFWDMWSTDAQGLIAREDYARLFQLCPPLTPATPLTITTVAITGDTAQVRTAPPTDFGFLFESGSWRYVPPSELQQEYQAKTVDQMVQERQTAGTCGTATTVPSATPPAPSATIPPVIPPTAPPAIPPTTPPAAPPAIPPTTPPAAPSATSPATVFLG